MMPSSDYSEAVWALFEAAPRSGRPASDGWVQAEARERLSGTWVRVYLRTAGGRVDDVRYEVRGCPHTVAATAWVAREWVGVDCASARMDARGLLAELAAPVTKLGRLLVVEAAYREALRAARDSA
jgi:NifU-like protein involved in Fe-S cluster formation